MKSDIKEKYNKCEECLVHSTSKPGPNYHSRPLDLALMAPNEVISCDHLEILKKDVLVVKCHSSGFILAHMTKDKTVDNCKVLQ